MNKKLLCGILALALMFAFVTPNLTKVSAADRDTGTYNAYIEFKTPSGKIISGNGKITKDGVVRPYAMVYVNNASYEVPWETLLVKYTK